MRIAVCDNDEREISRIGKLIAEYQMAWFYLPHSAKIWRHLFFFSKRGIVCSARLPVNRIVKGKERRSEA